MPVYSAFAVPTLGMMSQSAAMNNIGNNIANMTTGGYKRTDTGFSTLVSKSLFEQSDLGGVKPQNLQRIDQQGALKASANDLDLAINGRGMFIFNTEFGGGGDTLYGRDGSFEMRTVNDISVTGIGGTTVTTKDGYLVDKNGYFLQGYTADPTTGLFTSLSLSPLRVDQYAFSSIGQPTTNAKLQLNIPSTDTPGTSQADTIVLSGTIEAGDVYSVTVNGSTASYTTTGAEANLNVIRNALVAAVNADATVGGLVTASNSSTDNTLIISGNTIGEVLTTGSSGVNGGGTNDNAAMLTAAQIPSSGTTHTYNAEIIDSNFNSRSAAVNFRKDSTNTWSLTTTVNNTLVQQVDTATLAGTIEAGDLYSVTVNGETVSVTLTGAEPDIDAVRDALVAAYNADPTASAIATATATTTGQFSITAKTAGTTLTTSVNATNGAVAVAKVDTLTIGGTIEAGDRYDVVVDGNTVTYITTGAEGTLAGLRSAIRAAINLDGTVGPLVTAADSGGGGDITLTAATPGTTFTSSITATNLGGTADNTGTVTTTTANVTSTADNTSSITTTTANVTPTLTTDIATLKFDSNGTLISPTSGLVTLALTFPADGTFPAGTASVTLDISEISQFAGDFLPISYSKDGFAKANLTGVNFDANGQVVAKFDNSTFRAIYKIPLAQFTNVNGLHEVNGNVYKETVDSGTARVVLADETGYASFLPNTYELSNVDLAGEFTRMIQTQTAYNSSSTVFRTVDEMVQAAGEMKR